MFLLLTVLGRDAGLQVDLQADLASLKGCRGERADHGLVPPLLCLAQLHAASPGRWVWRLPVTGDAKSELGPLWGAVWSWVRKGTCK